MFYSMFIFVFSSMKLRLTSAGAADEFLNLSNKNTLDYSDVWCNFRLLESIATTPIFY